MIILIKVLDNFLYNLEFVLDKLGYNLPAQIQKTNIPFDKQEINHGRNPL